LGPRPASSWHSRHFSHFLYDQFLPPSRCHGSGKSKPSQTDAALRRQEGQFVLPNIQDVQIELVELADVAPPSCSKSLRGRKPNYLAEAVRNTKLGNHGEDLIVRYEHQVLRDANRDDLAKKVKRVSVDDDSLGYDILSFTTSGDARYIEVKSTTGGSSANVPFNLTENERQKMTEMGDSYFLYRLMDANTRTPKLIVLNASQFSERCKMDAKLWQVTFT